MSGSKVGITTTLPVEVIFSAGMVPVDLNNMFIGREDAYQMVEGAEAVGYPRSFCAWVKGIYSVVLDEGIETVVGVVQGDCANTHALMETLKDEGVEIIPFAYPYDRSYEKLALEIECFASRLGTSIDDAERWKTKLDVIRSMVLVIEEANIDRRFLPASEVNQLLLSTSDMEGNVESFKARVEGALKATERDAPKRSGPRIGVVGIPPIFTDFYEYIEGELGLECVYIEVARQFALPFGGDDIVEAYRRYTYPYGIFARIEDIEREVARRAINGIIHYVQGFCFRQVETMILRRRLELPILQIEGDRPGNLDERTKLHLESFAEMLS
ncbi:MAG: 2-hydroxyacyl-CoA dehydratase [Candidatus Coatesbacteria bacterium]|nr:MAG: 2-hydroxyacyl-CoA dehydratase [Candidatus Coatesbacteria bacterium]